MRGIMNTDKGTAFDGFVSGQNYDIFARLFGLNASFYEEAVRGLALGPKMAALDLGCGTGSLSFALAAQSAPQCRIYGLDLAENQISRAQSRQKAYSCDFHFSVASMDEACFPDGTFSIIMTAMAMHEATPHARRAAIANAARMLAPEGIFLLVDIGRPQLRGLGLLLYPFVMTSAKHRDGLADNYADICAAHGLSRREDGYLNSLVRKQVFVKTTAPAA